MKLLRDFECTACGNTTERYIDAEETEILCDCGEIAFRIIGMPHVSLEGVSGDFPGAHSKWAKTREDRHRQNAKKNR